MGQAQINVRTRACSRTSIARTRQAALTHNVRGKELTTVKKGSYDGSDMWPNQVASAKRLCKAQYQGKEKEESIRKDEYDIRELIGLDFNSSQRAAKDHQRWQKIVANVNSAAPTTLMVPGHR